MKHIHDVLRHILKCRTQLLIILLCMILIMAMNFLLPFFTQKLFDEGFCANNIRVIVTYAGLICCFGIVLGIASILKEKCRVRIHSRLYHRLAKDAIAQLMCIDMEYFIDNNPTSIFQALSEDIDNITSLADEDMFEIITSAFSAIGGGVALFMIDWHMALLVIAFIPVQLLLSYFMLRKGVRIVGEYNAKSNDYSKSFGNAVQGVKDIRLGGIGESSSVSLLQKLASVLKVSEKKKVFQHIAIESEGMFVYIITSIGAITAGGLLINGKITLGSIIAFQTYSLMLLNSVCAAIGTLYNIGSISPSLKRYYSFLQFRRESEGDNSTVKPGNISINGVSFGYGGDGDVFQHCNLQVGLGSKVAVTGLNGSGKTTIMNLILRLLTPHSGTITIDGVDISTYNLVAYRSLFCVVFQDPFLFNTTIRDNICMFNSDISDKRLQEIVDAVNLKDVVDSKGLNYEIGENGKRLSAGQRQKLALARVLAYNRPYIILDEFTSNMDEDTIMVLRKLFETEFKSKTVICITHSRPLLNLFDSVLTIDNGIIRVDNNESSNSR